MCSGSNPKYISGYLEVVDIVSKVLRYIPVPGLASIFNWLNNCLVQITFIDVYML